MLSGRLTKDAELTSIGMNNTPKLMFSIAVERAYQKDKNNKVVDLDNHVSKILFGLLKA
jgi:single-stranded DNA-binding protein